jgi:hypothetical protein
MVFKAYVALVILLQSTESAIPEKCDPTDYSHQFTFRRAFGNVDAP